MLEIANEKVLRDCIKDVCACLVDTVTNNLIGQNMLAVRNRMAIRQLDISHEETYFRGRALDLKVDVESADNMKTDNIFLHFTSQPIPGRTYLASLSEKGRGRGRERERPFIWHIWCDEFRCQFF